MSAALNRREFLTAGAAGAGVVLLANQFARAGQTENWPPKMPPVKIYQVYIGRTGGIYLSRPTAEIKFSSFFLLKVFVKRVNRRQCILKVNLAFNIRRGAPEN